METYKFRSLNADESGEAVEQAHQGTANDRGWVNGVHCPRHDDSNPSSGVNLETQKLHCFVCNATWDIDGLGEIPPHKKMQFIMERIKRIRKEESGSKEYDIVYSKGVVPQYMLERGFSEEDMVAFDCGVDVAGNLIIPIKDRFGVTVGTITRYTNDYSSKRYLYSPEGLAISKQLFGIDKLYNKVVDTLYITEGAIDAMWLWKFGYPAVALLGSGIKKKKADIIKQVSFSGLVLVMDNDMAGVELYKSIKRYFKGFQDKLGCINPPIAVKDIQDVRDPNLMDVVMSNVRWESRMRRKSII